MTGPGCRSLLVGSGGANGDPGGGVSGCVAGVDGAGVLFTWANLTAVAAAVLGSLIAAGIAAAVAVRAYNRQHAETRRGQRATVYAEALRAVADYLEAPYRIRRRDGTAGARRAITDHISAVQSRLRFHQTWMRLHASDAVSGAYDALVDAARLDAGPQMSQAWRRAPTKRDRDVPLGLAYPQPHAAAARARAVAAMQDDLRAIRPQRRLARRSRRQSQAR